MTLKRRFYEFIESLKQPRRKFGAVCFLFAFLLADFLFAGIYFLTGYFALKTIGPAAEMAAEMADFYKISVFVDTSEYLWWSIPFFALAIITAVFMIRYIVMQHRIFARAKRPARPKERIHARPDAVVAVPVQAVNPEQAKHEDLRNKPPAWLLDPLAVVSPNGTVQQEAPQRNPQPTPQPFSYSDFVKPSYSSSIPHNTVQRPRKKDAEIPYAGSLQYVPRTDRKKKKNESPYSPYDY